MRDDDQSGKGGNGPRDPWEGLADVIDVPLERLRAELAKSRGGVLIRGAEVRQIRTGNQSSQLAGAAGRLVGWSFRETAGAVATLYLRDGRDSTGDIIAALQLAPNESTRDSYFPGGLGFQLGLFVDVAAGTVEGSVYLGAVD